MRFRSILSVLVIQAFAFGLAFGDPAPKASIEPSQESSAKSESSPEPSLMSGVATQNAYITNAPLALFSVGSLAVGGIFYSLQSGMDHPKAGFMGGDRSSLGTAVGFAGLTALIAGVSYFYYSHRDSERNRAWDAQVSADVAPNGRMDLSAALVLPLPALTSLLP
jgi:hypothetical protein